MLIAIVGALFLSCIPAATVNALEGWAPTAISLDQSFVAGVPDLTKDSYQGIRRGLWFISHAVDAWGRWLARGLGFVIVALLIGLLDRNLIAAWREGGIRVLRTYVPMMLYVFVRLFFDRRVRLVAKLLLVAGVIYGVRRYDLVPDGSGLIPGYLEDVLLIGVAMRFFLYCSPSTAIEEYAAQAVNFRRRLAALNPNRQA